MGQSLQDFGRSISQTVGDIGKDNPIAQGVEVGLLAGNHADLGSFKNETDGPSDGIILVNSALQPPRDAKVRKSELLPLNHLELAWSNQAQQWVSDFLAS